MPSSAVRVAGLLIPSSAKTLKGCSAKLEEELPNGSAKATRPVRVLVVDDNRDSVLTLGILLRSEGYEVRLVESGKAALIEAQEFRPDVALLDLDMPDVSGFAVAQLLCRAQGAQRPALIAVTGRRGSEDQNGAEVSGFRHYVTKPYDPVWLLTLLASIMKAA
jgi:CheY-like chemotaxis protein